MKKKIKLYIQIYIRYDDTYDLYANSCCESLSFSLTTTSKIRTKSPQLSLAFAYKLLIGCATVLVCVFVRSLCISYYIHGTRTLFYSTTRTRFVHYYTHIMIMCFACCLAWIECTSPSWIQNPNSNDCMRRIYTVSCRLFEIFSIFLSILDWRKEVVCRKVVLCSGASASWLLRYFRRDRHRFRLP